LAGVLAGQLISGAAIPPIVVAVITLLQRLAPARLQGRVYAALEVSLTGPQTAGIAIGAALVGVVDYRFILIGSAVLLAASAVTLNRRPAESDRSPRRPIAAPGDLSG
jgi:predicted MFS family arabinose efflux permease